MTENKFENKGMTQLLQNGSFFFFFTTRIIAPAIDRSLKRRKLLVIPKITQSLRFTFLSLPLSLLFFFLCTSDCAASASITR